MIIQSISPSRRDKFGRFIKGGHYGIEFKIT